jgi:ubiquinone/menaquinone biosynthesis C-methylase UbiE
MMMNEQSPKGSAPHRPPPISQWQNEFEKKVATEFERRTGHDYKDTLSLVSEAADLSLGMQVLDVPTGSGVVARQLLRLVGEKGKVVGVDGAAMIEQARLAAQSLGVGRRIEWKVGRAEKLPFAEESFDLVTCVLSFNLVQRDQFLEEALRVLKPGGRLLLALELLPKEGQLRRAARRNYFQFIARDQAEGNAQDYTVEDVVSLLLAAGFHQYVIRGVRQGSKHDMVFTLVTAKK